MQVKDDRNSVASHTCSRNGYGIQHSVTLFYRFPCGRHSIYKRLTLESQILFSSPIVALHDDLPLVLLAFSFNFGSFAFILSHYFSPNGFSSTLMPALPLRQASPRCGSSLRRVSPTKFSLGKGVLCVF